MPPSTRVAPLLAALAALAALSARAAALAPTAADARRFPPRGYNPCNNVGCDMSALGEPRLLALMDAIAANGMRDANFTWFNLDDGIISHRDNATGALVADAAFTGGSLAALAAHAAARGLSLGAYTDRGARTCEGRPGSAGHEAQDAATWVGWGVRWLKSDSCNASGDFVQAAAEYGLMKAGLAATGADVFLSLCGWFSGFAAFSALPLGDAWRVGTDVPSPTRFAQNVEAAAAAARFAGPGRGWPDLDMIGGAWAPTMERLHVSLIALVGAPLLLSWDVSLPAAPSGLALAAYLNPELLAIHADDAAPAVAARGQYYARLAGAPATAARGVAPPTLPLDTAAPCGAARAQWAFSPNASGWGALEAAGGAPGFCLGLWDEWGGACIDALAAQLVPCGAANASDGCPAAAQQWAFGADGTLDTALSWGGNNARPGALLTLVGRVPGALFVQSAAPAAPPFTLDQQWARAGGALRNAATGLCLAPPAPAPAGNVWARWLAGGDVALLFFNFGDGAADVACDAACLAAAGITGVRAARDVWARADAGAVDAAAGFVARALPGGGGSLLLRVRGA